MGGWVSREEVLVHFLGVELVQTASRLTPTQWHSSCRCFVELSDLTDIGKL